MKSAHALGAAALIGTSLLAPPAAAQTTIESLGLTVTATPGVTTDYLFRGISQTRSRPAAQLTLDVEHESGIYIGAFLSNAAFAGTDIRQELDLLAGYRFSLGPVKLDAGVIYYGYPGYDRPPGGFDAAWFEAGLRATYELEPFKLVGSAFYSPNYNFESGNAVYVEGGFDLAAGSGYTLAARAGYQWIDRNLQSAARPTRGFWGAGDYAVFSLTLSREIAYGVVGAVQFSHVTLDRDDCFGGLKLCGTRVVGTLSRPF